MTEPTGDIKKDIANIIRLLNEPQNSTNQFDSFTLQSLIQNTIRDSIKEHLGNIKKGSIETQKVDLGSIPVPNNWKIKNIEGIRNIKNIFGIEDIVEVRYQLEYDNKGKTKLEEESA